MIGMFADHSSTFLRAVALLTVVGFSVPIALAPFAWARAFRWPVDQQTDLALYFGRCLGAVAVVLSWAAWHVAAHPEFQPMLFQILIGATLLLGIVHVVGAVQRAQPWTETVEIPLWCGLAVLAALFYPNA
jgi:hypothetical protein